MAELRIRGTAAVAALIAALGANPAPASDPDRGGAVPGEAPRTDAAPAGTTGDEGRAAGRPDALDGGTVPEPRADDATTPRRPTGSERSQEDASDAEEPRAPRGAP